MVTWPLLMLDAKYMVDVVEMVVVDGENEFVAVNGGVVAVVVAAAGDEAVDDRIGVAVQGETVCKY